MFEYMKGVFIVKDKESVLYWKLYYQEYVFLFWLSLSILIVGILSIFLTSNRGETIVFSLSFAIFIGAIVVYNWKKEGYMLTTSIHTHSELPDLKALSRSEVEKTNNGLYTLLVLFLNFITPIVLKTKGEMPYKIVLINLLVIIILYSAKESYQLRKLYFIDCSVCVIAYNPLLRTDLTYTEMSNYLKDNEFNSRYSQMKAKDLLILEEYKEQKKLLKGTPQLESRKNDLYKVRYELFSNYCITEYHNLSNFLGHQQALHKLSTKNKQEADKRMTALKNTLNEK